MGDRRGVCRVVLIAARHMENQTNDGASQSWNCGEPIRSCVDGMNGLCSPMRIG